MTGLVDPDDLSTWPTDVIALVSENAQLIRNYESHQARIGGLSTSAYLAAGQPTNPFRAERDRIVAKIDEVLSKVWLAGYHATRLTPSEASRLDRGLLEVLSMDLVQRRIDQACADGLLSHTHADELAKSSLVRSPEQLHGRRLGMVWMVFFKIVLNDDGLYRLFRYWGGEAIYGPHEQTEIGEALKRIGRPTLLKCEVPVSDLHPSYPIAGRFTAAFMEKQ